MSSNKNILATFHKDPINKQFVREEFERYIGQGLYRCGKTTLIGNGYNRYIMEVEYLGKRGTIIFEEKHIERWELRCTPEEDEPEFPSFEFTGFGMLEGEYYEFEHFHNQDDSDDSNNKLYIKDEYDTIIFEVIKINVECYVTAPIGSNNRDDWINECRADVRKTKAENLNVQKVKYETFMNEPGDYCLYDEGRIILEFTKIKSYKSAETKRSKDSSDVVIGDYKCTMEHFDISDENHEYESDGADVKVDVVYKKFGSTKKISEYCYIGKLNVDLSFIDGFL
jgi:acetyltransferase-like isoleucine patch superfamily enzyme